MWGKRSRRGKGITIIGLAPWRLERNNIPSQAASASSHWVSWVVNWVKKVLTFSVLQKLKVNYSLVNGCLILLYFQHLHTVEAHHLNSHQMHHSQHMDLHKFRRIGNLWHPCFTSMYLCLGARYHRIMVSDHNFVRTQMPEAQNRNKLRLEVIYYTCTITFSSAYSLYMTNFTEQASSACIIVKLTCKSNKLVNTARSYAQNDQFR